MLIFYPCFEENEKLFHKIRDNCSQPAILDFPSIVIPGGKLGSVLIPALITIYLYLLLTAVCEDYFITSINMLCTRLGLHKDIAGPTLLAAASSSPELFINIIGTFITEGDIGIGTIVGSALFNVLAVPALCGLFACKVIQLHPWPLFRDSFIYSLAVIVLVIVLLDGKVEWYEALIFIFLYFLYITVMYWNKSLQQYFESIYFGTENHEAEQLITSGLEDTKKSPVEEETDVEEVEDSQSLESLPYEETTAKKSYDVITFPITFVLACTIPDCRLQKKLYVVSFGLCIMWIALATYLIAWMITIIGNTLHISDSIMGLTFIAIGLSLPEAVVSVIVARKGDVTMAISNSLGSNTFDILLCLGLPWLLKSICFSPTGVNYVIINSKGIGYSSAFLFLVLFILIFLFYINKFQLDKKIGFIFLLMYILFVTISVILETDIFSLRKLPTCPVPPL